MKVPFNHMKSFSCIFPGKVWLSCKKSVPVIIAKSLLKVADVSCTQCEVVYLFCNGSPNDQTKNS